MVTLIYLSDSKIKFTSNPKEILKISKSNYLWFDFLDVSEQEKSKFEEEFEINIPCLNNQKIKHSNRFFENDGTLFINLHLLVKKDEYLIDKPVSFLLCENYLISNHNISRLSITEFYKEICHVNLGIYDGKLIFLKIIERILEIDVDSLERKTDKIVNLSKKITSKSNLDEDLVYELAKLQEELVQFRKNIIQKQMVVSSIFKSEYFNRKILLKHILIIEKDISSIIEHLSFDFERLEYLQDTLMGLINLRQNLIMKIFTIVSVIFLPPTLIASIYGMNFSNMPELHFPYAYPIAIIGMLFLSIIALMIFKYKKWI